MMLQLPVPEIAPQQANNTARSVVNGRAYLEAARPPSLRERFFDWIQDVIGDLLDALSSGGGRGLIAWVIVALFGALVVFLLSRLMQRFEPLPQRDAAPDPEIGVFTETTAPEWIALALEHEQAGEWRLGLRCRHRALAVELIDAGLVENRPGLTAAAMRRDAVRQHSPLADPLTEATDLFEAVWYGPAHGGVAERDRFVALADAVRATLDDQREAVLT